MAEMELDWTALQAAASTAAGPPSGDYTAVVQSATSGFTSTGKHHVTPRFVIEGGPQNGQAMPRMIVISPENPRALKIAFRHLAALGITPAPGQSMAQIAELIVGRRAIITVGQAAKEFMGEKGQEIQNVKPLVGAVPGAGPVAASGPPAPGAVAAVAAAPPQPAASAVAASPVADAPPQPTAPPARPF